MQIKAEKHIFQTQKFFTTLKSFLPHFYTSAVTYFHVGGMAQKFWSKIFGKSIFFQSSETFRILTGVFVDGFEVVAAP